MSSIRSRVVEVLQQMGHQVHGPLELDSLTIVQLHERLELTFDVRIRARDITPESFDTLEGLAALVSSRLRGGEQR